MRKKTVGKSGEKKPEESTTRRDSDRWWRQARGRDDQNFPANAIPGARVVASSGQVWKTRDFWSSASHYHEEHPA